MKLGACQISSGYRYLMQSFREKEQQQTVTVLEHTCEHIEADLHAEARAMCGEIHELKSRCRADRRAARRCRAGRTKTLLLKL